MPDREKVIGHLNDCMEASRRDNTWVFVRKDIVEDALALLKEQEPVKPDFFMDGRAQRFACKKCGKHLLYAEWGRDNYCSKCGQAVKWE